VLRRCALGIYMSISSNTLMENSMPYYHTNIFIWGLSLHDYLPGSVVYLLGNK
jgi:hypothetical protein